MFDWDYTAGSISIFRDSDLGFFRSEAQLRLRNYVRMWLEEDIAICRAGADPLTAYLPPLSRAATSQIGDDFDVSPEFHVNRTPNVATDLLSCSIVYRGPGVALQIWS